MSELAQYSLLRWAALALVFLGAFLIVLLATQVPIPLRARLGHRGVERTRALQAGGFFARGEPLIRFVAGILGDLSLAGLRVRQEGELRRADHVLGLTPDEYSALCLLSGACLGGIAFALVAAVGASPLIGFMGLALGFILPVLQVREVVRERTKVVSRGLPHAIEIAALCMGAGLDFPGSLRLLAGGRDQRKDALTREFAVILEELDLGHTRRDALIGFAERVPSPAVRDFVSAVIQAEQRGNPLAKVLQIQGRMLNMRRSVAAEEAAARAGVMMMFPMVLLVSCILLLLLGPFIVSGIGF